MRQLKSILYDVGHWFASLNSKRIFIILVIVALIAAPTGFAIAYVIYNDFLQVDNHYSIALYDEGDELIAYEEQADDTEPQPLTTIFRQLVQSPTSPSSDTSLTGNGKYVRAVTTLNGVSSELKCYFSVDEASGYYIDSKNQKYLIPNELNRRFLSTEYAERFYDASVCHSLFTVDGDKITPRNVNWYYKNASEEFNKALCNSVTSEQENYEITGALEIGFEVKPDRCRIQVFQNDTRIYDGDEDELSSLTVSSNDELHVLITSEWYKKNNCESYGSIEYDFNIHIKNRSSFYVNKNVVYSGGFVILDCTNITDISKIKFECDDSTYSPIFRKYNGGARSVIEFPESEAALSFDFSVSYGASSQSFSISVLPADISGSFSDTELRFSDVDTPKQLNKAIRDMIFSIPLPQNDAVYFQGNFYDPLESGFLAAYTHNGEMNWGKELQYSYIALGNEYILSADTLSGASVRAIQNGVVSYIGNSVELGRFIVVDHGCGLRTWYTGLGAIDVSIGDIVLTGQHIGKTGESLIFKNEEGFRLFCTVYDTMIDPNTLWE